MKTWNVIIPCTLAIAVTVTAENEQEAKKAAFDVSFNLEIVAGKDSEAAHPEIIEFETHDKVTAGNVYYGCINDMEIEEV